MKETITYDEFCKIDMRIGTIIDAKLNEKAKVPAYELTLDFGDEIGIKKSSAQITKHYTCTDLIGKKIAAVVNFPPKRVAGVKSEVLILGSCHTKDDVYLLSGDDSAPNGAKIA